MEKFQKNYRVVYQYKSQEVLFYESLDEYLKKSNEMNPRRNIRETLGGMFEIVQ